MKVLPLIFCFGSVLCFSGSKLFSRNNNLRADSDDGLLSGLTEEAISEYYKIVQNTSQTLMQWETALQSWAKKYGVEEKYKAQLAKFEKEQAAYQQSLTELVKTLNTFLRKYMELGNNKNQTIDSLFNEAEELYNTLDKKQKSVVSFIIKTYSLTMEENSEENAGFSENNGEFSGTDEGFLGNNGGFPGSNGEFPRSNGRSSGNNRGFPGSNGRFSENNWKHPRNTGSYNAYNGGTF